MRRFIGSYGFNAAARIWPNRKSPALDASRPLGQVPGPARGLWIMPYLVVKVTTGVPVGGGRRGIWPSWCADSALQVLFDGADGAPDLVLHALAVGRESDQPGAAVAGVGCHLHHPGGLQGGHELAERLLGHVGPLGQVAEPDAFRRGVVEQSVVRRSQPGHRWDGGLEDLRPTVQLDTTIDAPQAPCSACSPTGA
jgi:hypothetical protein